MREKLALIRGWLKYLAAVSNWVASVLALETFPKKSDFFGTDSSTGAATNPGADTPGTNTQDGANVAGSKPI